MPCGTPYDVADSIAVRGRRFGNERSSAGTQDVSPAQIRVLATAGLGFLADAYDLFIIGIVIAVLTPLWHLSSLDVSLVGSVSRTAQRRALALWKS